MFYLPTSQWPRASLEFAVRTEPRVPRRTYQDPRPPACPVLTGFRTLVKRVPETAAPQGTSDEEPGGWVRVGS